MSDRPNWKRTVIWLTTVAFLLVFFVVVLFFVFFTLSEKNRVESQTYNYKFLEYNSKTDENSVSLYASKEYIPPGEFKTYSYPPDNKHILISNFGSKEYKCTGSCYCETDNRRNIGALNPIARGLIILVVSVSAIVGANVAVEYFRTNCQKDFKDKCPPENVMAEVEYCKDMEYTEYTEEEIEEVNFKDRSIRKFLCHGYCVPYLKTRPIPKMEDCQIGKRMSDTYVYSTTGELLHDLKLAREQFRSQFLQYYCWGFGKHLNWRKSEAPREGPRCYAGKELHLNIHCDISKEEGLANYPNDD